MGSSTIPATVIVAVAVLVLMATSRGAEGQPPPASCAMKLQPCLSYINSTVTPPASCCDPLKEVLTKELQCLCNLYNTPGLLAAIGINVTQALRLPGRCNFSGGLCANASAPTPASSEPPPATTTGNNDNGASRIAWTGFTTILLIWASTMLF